PRRAAPRPPPRPRRGSPRSPNRRCRRRAEFEYESVRKNVRVAYLLWAVCGLFGGHRFYLGDTGRSIAMLFTLGGLGVWSLVDVFFVGRRVRTVNGRRRAAI